MDRLVMGMCYPGMVLARSGRDKLIRSQKIPYAGKDFDHLYLEIVGSDEFSDNRDRLYMGGCGSTGIYSVESNIESCCKVYNGVDTGRPRRRSRELRQTSSLCRKLESLYGLTIADLKWILYDSPRRVPPPHPTGAGALCPPPRSLITVK